MFAQSETCKYNSSGKVKGIEFVQTRKGKGSKQQSYKGSRWTIFEE